MVEEKKERTVSEGAIADIILPRVTIRLEPGGSKCDTSRNIFSTDFVNCSRIFLDGNIQLLE